MSDQNQVGLSHWTDRSRGWTATAAEGRSTDDTFNRMMIEAAGIAPGRDVLDLCSGTGDPAISIGLALEGSGSVTACDLTPAMLGKARERSVNVGIANMRFAAAEMTALPFRNESFDVVTCRFGLMFPADRVAAAAEALRILRPGGRAAWLVWGPYEENPPFYVLRRGVARAHGRDEGPPPQRHCLGGGGEVAAILTAAGYQGVIESELRYDREVADIADYIDRGLRRGYADEVAALGEAARAALYDDLRRDFEPWRDGAVWRLPNFAVLGIGRKG